jgi:hypothetical protein
MEKPGAYRFFPDGGRRFLQNRGSLHKDAGHHKMQEVPLSEACHPQRTVVKVCVLFVKEN